MQLFFITFIEPLSYVHIGESTGRLTKFSGLVFPSAIKVF